MNPDKENFYFFETSGYSMWPFLRQQDKCIVKKVPFKSLKIGDIVIYTHDSQIICHRLIRKIKDENGKLFLCVRGDNSLSSPELLDEDVFMGKVFSTVRNNKEFSQVNYKQRLFNRIIVIIAPLISLAIKILKPFSRCFKEVK